MRVLITYPDSFLGSFIKNKLKDSFGIYDKYVDYEDYEETKNIFEETIPDVLIINIPFNGGIKFNIEKPAELITKNIIIQTNVIRCAFRNNIKKLIYIGSSCMYPKIFDKPLKEKDLFSGSLEETNQAYATAKIAGWQMCKAFNAQYRTHYQTLIPANLYGEYDDFNEDTAHVIGSLISRFHKAKLEGKGDVTVWGTGKPVRDFLYAGDLGDAIAFFLNNDIPFDEVNISSGYGYSIKEIAETIANIADYKGRIVFNTSKPDGVRMKVLSAEKINTLGWKPKISLEEGIKRTYTWYSTNRNIRRNE